MRLLLVLALSSFAFGQHVVSGGHTIKGSHTVSSTSAAAPSMAEDTVKLLGTSSKLSQTPTLFPNESTIQLDSGPAGLLSAWCSAIYRDANHQMVIKACGGHNDYGGNEGYVLDITATGGTFAGTWSRLQVSGADDEPTLPIDMNIAGTGNFSLPASGGANCPDDGTTHANCDIGPRHTYTGEAYIPPAAVSCNGITGDAMYFVGGISLNTVGGVGGSDAWIIPLNSADSLYPNHLRLDNWWTKTGGTFQPGTDAVAGWYNGSIWIYDAGATGTSGSATLWQHDLCAQTIKSRASLTTAASFTGTTGVVDSTNGKMLLWYPDTTTSRKLHTVLLSSPYTDTDITSLLDSNCSGLISGGASSGTFWTQYPGMAFNPDKGVIGVYPSYGQDFWEINLADNTCSHVTLGGDTIPTADFGGNGTFGRLQYDTGYHTYVLVVTDIAKQAALICRQHGGCTPDVANNFASVSAGTGIPGGATNLIRAVSFDSASDYPKTATEAVGQGITIRPENGGPPYVYDADVTTDGTAADGDGYLRFTAATLHGGDYGWVRIPFNDSDLTHQVGEGQEFCYQFRFRINDAILDTLWQDRTLDPPAYPTPGWKLASASAGDWGTTFMQSCEAPELVFQNTQLFNVPQMYHSCHDKDSSSPPFNSRGYSDPDLGLTNFLIQPNGPCSNYGSHTQPPCKGFQRNKWQTYEMCAKVGTWYRNDSVYHKDSTVTAYAADENEAPQTLLSFTDYDLVNGALSGTTCGVDEPCYGNIILFPYHLNVNEFQSHATGYYDYDSLVIAKRFIPFPGTRVPNPPDQLAASIVSSSRIDLSWRDNSSDELAFKIDKCQGSDIACWRGAAAFVEVARVAANTTSYSATGLTTGTQYTFRVSAVNGYGDSPWAGGTCTWADNPCYATATTP